MILPTMHFPTKEFSQNNILQKKHSLLLSILLKKICDLIKDNNACDCTIEQQSKISCLDIFLLALHLRFLKKFLQQFEKLPWGAPPPPHGNLFIRGKKYK
jgi:hypothetical protein